MTLREEILQNSGILLEYGNYQPKIDKIIPGKYCAARIQIAPELSDIGVVAPVIAKIVKVDKEKKRALITPVADPYDGHAITEYKKNHTIDIDIKNINHIGISASDVLHKIKATAKQDAKLYRIKKVFSKIADDFIAYMEKQNFTTKKEALRFLNQIDEEWFIDRYPSLKGDDSYYIWDGLSTFDEVKEYLSTLRN